MIPPSLAIETSPPNAAPACGEAHLWRVSLDVGRRELEERVAVLDREERQRMERFRRGRDRARFASAHGALRMVLARYRGAQPADVRLSRDERGKPRMEGCSAGFSFSFAASGEIALVAVSGDAAVGVDVERIEPDAMNGEVAARIFTVEERSSLEALTVEERLDASFALWVCKEAYLKGRGVGLAVPPATVQIELSGIDASARARGRPLAGDPSWYALLFSPRERYIGACAVPGDRLSVRAFAYPA